MRPPPSDRRPTSQAGFTLLEAILVIVITGMVGAMVGVFLKGPIDAYFDSVRRAGLSDTADTALRRMGRDLRLGVPNSVRVSDDRQFVEVLLTHSVGRYRADDDPGSATDDSLDFTANDTAFDNLGPPISFAAGDQIVVYNLGIAGADAYPGDVRRAFSGVAGSRVSIASGQALPFDSPSHRFQVSAGPVGFLCQGGRLYRVQGYGIQTTVAAAYAAAAAAATEVLADSVSACSFDYEQAALRRNGLISLGMQLTRAGETVNLFHQVHVSNSP